MSDISTGLWDCFSVNLPEENALVKIDDSGGGTHMKPFSCKSCLVKKEKQCSLNDLEKDAK